MRGWIGSVLALALLLIPTTSASAQAGPSPSTAPAISDAPAAGAPPVLPIPVLSSDETHPEIKSVAIEIALALTTYEAHHGSADIAPGLPREVATALHHPGEWSRGYILYPQFGGLTQDSVSVMVVVEQMRGTAAGILVETRTLDIRLVRRASQWVFSALASDGGSPVALPPDLGPEALAVLGDPRIELPDSARWDIYAGLVSPKLLAVMARMADVAPYAVVTLSTGHPWEIFGTDRQSDHSRGRAVDVYRVGAVPVIADRATGSPTHAMVTWLHAHPDVARLGSPWFLGPGSFTDALHQDHLHIAVDP